jgi:hypothetical protein
MPRALILLALAGAAITANYPAVPADMHPLLALPFLLVGPGIAWLSRPDQLNFAASAAVAVSLTLAIETAIGTLLVVCGFWSPQAGLGMLLVISVAGLICTGNNRRNAPASSAEQDAGR